MRHVARKQHSEYPNKSIGGGCGGMVMFFGRVIVEKETHRTRVLMAVIIVYCLLHFVQHIFT
jgi:hypothetical protein